MEHDVQQRDELSPRIDRSLSRLCELASTVLEADSAGIHLRGSDHGWVRRTSTDDHPDSFSPELVDLLDSTDPKFVEDLTDTSLPTTDPWRADDQVRSLVAVPLTGDRTGQPLGMLVATAKRPGAFHGADREVLDHLADLSRDLVESDRARQSTSRARTDLIEESRKRERLIDRLERSNRHLEQFAYVASHDLQEPLRMITGFLGLLEDEYAGQLDETADEYIEFAVDGAKRMKSMIDGLLQYSRVGSSDEPFEPVDTGAIFRTVRRELTATHPDLDLDIEAPDQLPTVPGRRNQLRRVFSNLLSNAIHYSDQPIRVEVDCEHRSDEWLFSVRDNGRGVPADKRDDIFDLFVSGTARRGRDNTGLGLAICKTVVEEHGGSIWIDQAPDDGSIFYFTITREQPGS